MHESHSDLDLLRADHRVVLAQLLEIENNVPRAPGQSAVRKHIGEAVRHLEAQFATHMRAEEGALFPQLTRCIPCSAAAVDLLLDEHRELRSLLSEASALLAGAETGDEEASHALLVLWTDFATLLREHIRKEEGAVFHLADQMLSAEEWNAVSDGMRRFHPDRPAAKGKD